MAGGMSDVRPSLKRQAFFEHLEFCNRSVRRSALKYPWDLKLQYNPHKSFEMIRPAGVTPVVLNSVAIEDQQTVEQKAPPSLCRKFWMKQPRIDWEVKLNAVREY